MQTKLWTTSVFFVLSLLAPGIGAAEFQNEGPVMCAAVQPSCRFGKNGEVSSITIGETEVDRTSECWKMYEAHCIAIGFRACLNALVDLQRDEEKKSEEKKVKRNKKTAK